MNKITKEKSGSAFVFGTLILSFLLILISSFKTIPDSGEVGSIILLSAFFIFIFGFFTSGNWIKSTQLVLIVGLIIILSTLTNPIIGIGIGVIAYGVLIYGFKIKLKKSDSKTSSSSISFFWTAIKWFVVTLLSTFISLGVEALFKI